MNDRTPSDYRAPFKGIVDVLGPPATKGERPGFGKPLPPMGGCATPPGAMREHPRDVARRCVQRAEHTTARAAHTTAYDPPMTFFSIASTGGPVAVVCCPTESADGCERDLVDAIAAIIEQAIDADRGTR